jgi:Raf kinase inhibitor-like YbhB/YbcL family protein
MPKQFGCGGGSNTPPLTIANVPAAAKSLALIVDDPEAPGGHFTHWVVWNIPPASKTVQGVEGQNSYGKTGWGPPCPPEGMHHYVFNLYALDTAVDVPPAKGRDDLEKAMAGHVVAQTELTGRYKR